jgi:hypothetical protein
MPKEKRKRMAKKYVAGVVVVQPVNHRVTWVLEEKVDDMLDMSCIMLCMVGIGPAEIIDGAATVAEDSGDLFMFISMTVYVGGEAQHKRIVGDV